MSAYLPATIPVFQILTNLGLVAPGYKMFTYLAGTSTKTSTYQDATGGSANTNPIVADSNGRFTIFLKIGISYKFVFTTPTDTDPPTSPIWTVDNIDTTNVSALYDSLGQIAIATVGTPSAVNYLVASNATTGNSPSLAAGGTDTNINLTLAGLGTGKVKLVSASNPVLTATGVTGGANYITVTNAIASSPVIISVDGTDTNADISLVAKGTGKVKYLSRELLPVPTVKTANTANYTLVHDDIGQVIPFNCTSGTLTATLPDAALENGFIVSILRTDSTTNSLNMTTAGGNIDNLAGVTIAAPGLVTYRSNGTGWFSVRPQEIYGTFYAANSQTLTSSVSAKLLIDSSFLAITNYFTIDATNHRIIPLIPGDYLVYAVLTLTVSNTPSSNGSVVVSIEKNGSITDTASGVAINTVPVLPTVSVQGIVSVNGSTDYIEVFATQVTGQNQATTNAPSSTKLIIVKL